MLRCKHCNEEIVDYPTGKNVNIKFKYIHKVSRSMYCDVFSGEGSRQYPAHFAEPSTELEPRNLRDIENDWPYGNRSALRELLTEAFEAGKREKQEQDVRTIIDMAERYDTDIEGCDADELTAYTEAISCCFRLAYKVKYGKSPGIKPEEFNANTREFVELFKQIRKEVNAASNPPAPVS